MNDGWAVKASLLDVHIADIRGLLLLRSLLDGHHQHALVNPVNYHIIR